jgi:CCR4-NOT transcription complex subunit 1
LSDAILDEIRKLCVSFESRNPSSAVRELANSDGGSDDIEVEANAYFQHMFSGQISVDSMIQMLGRFKESTDKRCKLKLNWNIFWTDFVAFLIRCVVWSL